MKRMIVFLLGLGLTVVAVAGRSWMGERALMDSARSVPPKMRMEWLYQRGRMEDRRLRTEDGPATADSGLVLRGKWGRGPAAEVTGKDTLVVLTLGSEVALLNFAKPDSPRVLSEIQFSSLTAQSYLEDSLLYTSSNADLEVWNIANPTEPVKRGQLLGTVGDFWIRDTFLYFIRSDTFHVVSIANPTNLYELGSCIESGSVTTGSGNTVVVCQSGGFAFVDVSNPASPHEVGTYPCGHTLSATARGNLVCASYDETADPYPVRFITLDISTPSSPRLLAELNDLGGYDIFLDGPVVFVSGRGPGVEPQPLQILSIADSAHPAFIDSCRTTTRYPWGIWENPSLNRALVAEEYDGLAIVDISNLNSPVLDTWVLKAGQARDVYVEGALCYVASGYAGMKILDVSDPMGPVCVGQFDSALVEANNYCVAARDSFAYACRSPFPRLRTILVSEPAQPSGVATCSTFNFPRDMVLCDSLLYISEDFKFQIVNVARPRAPAVVGTCALPEMMQQYGMDVRDTLAFVANGVVGLQIVNLARPDSPAIVGALTPPNGAIDVAVIDTFAYVVSGNLYVASVANPTSPYLIDSVVLPTFGWSVTASDSLLFIGSSGHVYGHPGNDIRLFDIANRAGPVPIGSLRAPDVVARLAWVEPHLFAACADAGVLIAETAAVGVQEARRAVGTRPALSVLPNPAGEIAHVRFGKPLGDGCRLSMYDALGKRLMIERVGKEVTSIELRLNGLSPGVYFVRAETETGIRSSKIVKQ
jgi:hypothetical protein